MRQVADFLSFTDIIHRDGGFDGPQTETRIASQPYADLNSVTDSASAR
jgi:hypothetical protein